MHIIILILFFIFSAAQSLFAQEYLIANSENKNDNEVTYEGELHANSERLFVVDDKRLSYKEQFYILSGSRLMIIFPTQELQAYDFYNSYINHRSYGPNWGENERNQFSADFICSGQILIADTSNMAGRMWKITAGVIAIRYDDLTQLVTVKFEDIHLAAVKHKK